MFNHLRRGLLLALAYTAVAHAAGKHESWHAVEKLKPGESVVVRVAGQQRFEDCTLISVDDSTLTCQRERDPNVNWDAASNARLVLPRAAIADVWLLQIGHDRHIARWIAVGVSVALVVAASVGGGTLGGLFVGGLVFAAWTAWLDNPMPYRLPPQPQISRRLIYRSTTP